MNQLTNYPRLHTRRHRAQVGHLEIAAYTAERELPRFRNTQQDRRRKNIDQCRSATTVQVAHVVAESRGDVDEEGDLGRRATGRGFEAQVAAARVDVPVLDGS